MVQNEKNRDIKEKPLIIYTLLDWGLGHTTRSIPLLRELAFNGWEIVVACNSIQKKILEPELPALTYTPLDGYNVKYSASGRLTKLVLSLQLIKILTKVNAENLWLKSFVERNRVHAIISDNRYGFFHPHIPSIFITHQLEPITGLGRMTDNMLRNFLYRYVNRFTECWVPDYKSGHTLAGRLSHPRVQPGIAVKYIGPLSRLDNIKPHNIRINLLFILSGPEPQRTVFENIVIAQLKKTNLEAVVIRGLPLNNDLPDPLHGVRFINHASANELNRLAVDAIFVICRSGYTSVMDMIKLKKKMIVVPTPGQTEQEYIARHLHKNKMALATTQQRFELSEILPVAAKFDYQFAAGSMEDYKEIIKNFTSLFFDNLSGKADRFAGHS